MNDEQSREAPQRLTLPRQRVLSLAWASIPSTASSSSSFIIFILQQHQVFLFRIIQNALPSISLSSLPQISAHSPLVHQRHSWKFSTQRWRPSFINTNPSLFHLTNDTPSSIYLPPPNRFHLICSSLTHVTPGNSLFRTPSPRSSGSIDDSTKFPRPRHRPIVPHPL